MTHYLIADTAQDYRKAHVLIQKEGMPDAPLNFPTVMAWHEGELIGVLGTDTTQNMIIAGPLVLRSDKRRPFTLLRLIETYERVMRVCGVTQYVFSVEDKNAHWLKQITELTELTPYAQQDGRAFYVRNL